METREQQPQIEKIRIDTLRVPPAGKAQRPFREAKGDRIAAEFEMNNFGFPVVCRVDGTNWVVDGQHRLYAIQKCGYAKASDLLQHDAVDPANRLVAAELERRWNDRLEALRQKARRGEAPRAPPSHRDDMPSPGVDLGQRQLRVVVHPGNVGETTRFTCAGSSRYHGTSPRAGGVSAHLDFPGPRSGPSPRARGEPECVGRRHGSVQVHPPRAGEQPW